MCSHVVELPAPQRPVRFPEYFGVEVNTPAPTRPLLSQSRFFAWCREWHSALKARYRAEGCATMDGLMAPEDWSSWGTRMYNCFRSVAPLELAPPWNGVTSGYVQIEYDCAALMPFHRHVMFCQPLWAGRYLHMRHRGRGHICIPDPHWPGRTLVVIWPSFGRPTNARLVRVPARPERDTSSEAPSSSSGEEEQSD